MAGPLQRIDYLSDDGHVYDLNIPQWQASVAGEGTGSTGTGSLPKGGRPRRRMMLNTGTGREYRVTFANVSLSAWTTGSGSSISYTRGNYGPPAGTYVWAGRIGERQLFKH